MTKKVIIVFSLALVVFLVVGCSSSRRAAISITELPIVKQQIKNSEKMKNKNISIQDTLSLDEAISRALESNPELQLFFTEIKAREARTLQESLLSNPELEVEFENFAGSGSINGLKGYETTLAIGQLIELGGKRAKRTRIAALESDIALLQYEIKRLNIITQVRSIFTQVLLAQKKLNLDRKLLGLSMSFKKNIDAQVKAGRLSRAESARAQVELSNRKLAKQRSIRELNNARRRLSATWGASEVGFTSVKGSLTYIKTIPKAEILMRSLEKSPLLIEQNTIVKKQKVKTELAEAQTIPDPLFSAGYRRFKETDDHAFVAGLSIPIPLFDRNQGGRQEAKLRELQSEQHLKILQNEIRTEINNQLETILNISGEIEIMKNIIIPEAQKAYDIIYQNYQLGKYAMIDVLDAQRQLFDSEGRYLEALVEMNLEIIALEGVFGQSLESL